MSTTCAYCALQKEEHSVKGSLASIVLDRLGDKVLGDFRKNNIQVWTRERRANGAKPLLEASPAPMRNVWGCVGAFTRDEWNVNRQSGAILPARWRYRWSTRRSDTPCVCLSHTLSKKKTARLSLSLSLSLPPTLSPSGVHTPATIERSLRPQKTAQWGPGNLREGTATLHSEVRPVMYPGFRRPSEW